MNSSIQTGTMFQESQNFINDCGDSMDLQSDAETCSLSSVNKENKKNHSKASSKESFYKALQMAKITESPFEVFYWGVNKHINKGS